MITTLSVLTVFSTALIPWIGITSKNLSKKGVASSALGWLANFFNRWRTTSYCNNKQRTTKDRFATVKNLSLSSGLITRQLHRCRVMEKSCQSSQSCQPSFKSKAKHPAQVFISFYFISLLFCSGLTIKRFKTTILQTDKYFEEIFNWFIKYRSLLLH